MDSSPLGCWIHRLIDQLQTNFQTFKSSLASSRHAFTIASSSELSNSTMRSSRQIGHAACSVAADWRLEKSRDIAANAALPAADPAVDDDRLPRIPHLVDPISPGPQKRCVHQNERGRFWHPQFGNWFWGPNWKFGSWFQVPERVSPKGGFHSK